MDKAQLRPAAPEWLEPDALGLQPDAGDHRELPRVVVAPCLVLVQKQIMNLRLEATS